MVLQKDDRVRVGEAEMFGMFRGMTGTVKATIEEWIYDKWGSESLQAQIARHYYSHLDAIIVLDYDNQEIAIQEQSVTLLADDTEVQQLEEMFDDSGVSGDQESTE